LAASPAGASAKEAMFDRTVVFRACGMTGRDARLWVFTAADR